MTLLRCQACGSAVMADPPGPAARAGGYSASGPRGRRAAALLLRAFDRRRLRILASVAPPPTRLLDVGAGRGRFVAAARAVGYDVHGLEPEASRLEAARAEYGVELQPSGIEDAVLPAGSFGAATLWHVLEHVEDPAAALERMREWLVPGGVVLIGVPNLASLQARLGGSRWYHLDLPRHRTHFTEDGLRRLLDRCGFEPAFTHHLLAEHNPFGMWQTLVNRLTRRPSYLFNLLQRNAPWRSPDLVVTLLALPLLPVAALLELGAGLARRGGTMAVVARRR